MTPPQLRLPAQIKAPIFERSVIATYKSGSIIMSPASTIYFTVPSDLVENLYLNHGINLEEHRKDYTIWATLVEERLTPDTNQLINILTAIIEDLTNQITQSAEMPAETLQKIDTQLKLAAQSIFNPPTTSHPPKLRVIYEIEKKEN